MKRVFCSEENILIDTYPEAGREPLPMFAENRVHQRTSGNPYPNKVVLEAQRTVREPRAYTLLKLRNEFLEIGILPALGGKIWYAKDLAGGYDFFYKNNVVKPALIGALGSWTSGGLEFNWPFHHRASTFMPVDYAIEQTDDEATVWLSEHDPIDRMKGMVGVSLRAGECVFTTEVKLDNTTPVRRSFLWWENAAVPVNPSYEIFFPEDVNYVRFHYKRSVTTYPIARTDRLGAYNGIRFADGTDISRHSNTVPATSYFSADSQYDYFGGYDGDKRAGVVHVADHHISPGKKLFTWGYGQLARTWENALTDTDGAYAELMAGCYSDNQPDFAWLEPYETKTFSQSWFPIHGYGTPAFANDGGALFRQEGTIYIQSVRPESGVTATLYKDGKSLLSRTFDLPAYEVVPLFKAESGARIILKAGCRTLMDYRFDQTYERPIPSPRKELPYFKRVRSADELYLEGVHMEQYRSPEYRGEACFEEALRREPEHAPSLLALAEIEIKRLCFDRALDRAEAAIASLTRFNERTESGKAYYLKGLALLGQKRFEAAYDALARAAWSYDYAAAANLHLGLLNIRFGRYQQAADTLQASSGVVAQAFYGYARYLSGDGAAESLRAAVTRDRLNLYAHALLALVTNEFGPLNRLIKTDKTQNALDIAEYLLEAGLQAQTLALFDGLERDGHLGASAQYVRLALAGGSGVKDDEGIAFPSRAVEAEALRIATERADDGKAEFLLGCLLYGKGRHAEGETHFGRACALNGDYRAWRCLAVAQYNRGAFAAAEKSLKRAEKSVAVLPKQLVFERVYVMFKRCMPPADIIDYLEKHGCDRDELAVELAHAYNRAGLPDKALDVLLGRRFVACEGGEHYIADQYAYAYYLKGRALFAGGDYAGARAEFAAAQTLPQSLGAGFWNEVKTVPFRYFEARCLQKLGAEEEARRILLSFREYCFDYFSDMYLPTLAYYVARSYELLGERGRGACLIEKKLTEGQEARRQKDTGPFGTTPFFISYLDEPAAARKRSLAYPLYMYAQFLGEKKLEEQYRKEWEKDGYALHIEDFTR